MKYALHTATNYSGTPHALRGCINDWKNFLRLDEELGIYDTTSLIDSDYTKSRATSEVKRLSSLMVAGDMLLASNSSHGTRVWDMDGDEADGMDEALVDHDCNLILDDDLYMGLKMFKPGTLIVAWLDNCHAGTMDRAFENWHLMSKDISCNAVMYFGCREEQTSADAYINGTFQGALTYCSLKALRDNKMNLTYLELLNKTNELLRMGRYTQIAQMAVTKPELLNQKVFTAL